MSGRLTLTWANKDRVLVSDRDGRYEWVAADDPRAREVRVLDAVSRHGAAGGEPENLLIRGDSVDGLRALARIPEYAQQYRGRVKLVYIDPPFNTKQAFEHYDDSLEHSVWLGMMRERLLLIRELLSPDGSVWVHLDDAEVHYAKVLMDELFGRQNFIATVVWEKSDSPRNSARYLSTDQDYVLVYAGASESWRPNRLARTAEVDAKYKNPDADPRGPWFGDNLRANKPYSLGRYSVVGPSGQSFEPPPGKFWRISQQSFEDLVADNRIWWGAKGDAFPTMKRFLGDVGEMVPRTLWRNADVGSNRSSSNEMKALFPKQEAFATPKPERLLERIIHIGSNPGDLVLDAFAGSGTTAAVAHKTRRRWVTIEQNEATVDTFTRPRLAKVVDGDDPGGITASVGWAGGGGFRELRVAPAAYAQAPEEFGGGVVVVANLPPGLLERSVAAQLGYHLDDAGPFIGRRGRSRLAVIDGLADETVVADAIAALEAGETATIAAIAFSPAARDLLAERVPGSRVRAIPQELWPALGVTR